jgi:hypothetical protein
MNVRGTGAGVCKIALDLDIRLDCVGMRDIMTGVREDRAGGRSIVTRVMVIKVGA